MTALELAGIDLWGTQLAVLSACDTGRGEVKLGQGIYGLRRALVVAGAETVVMSLWKVNDETTTSFMEKFYRNHRNLLARKRRGAALREAMLSMHAANPHPYYWAPFIALGRDTPLRGSRRREPRPVNGSSAVPWKQFPRWRRERGRPGIHAAPLGPSSRQAARWRSSRGATAYLQDDKPLDRSSLLNFPLQRT